MLGVEVEVAGPVLLQHPLDPVHRYRPARGAAAPAVDQTLDAVRLVLVPQPPEVPLRYPQHLRRLHTTQPSVPIAPQRIDDPGHPDLR